MLKFIDSIQILKKKIDENISYKEGVEHACRIFKSQGSKRLHVYIYICRSGSYSPYDYAEIITSKECYK